MIRKKLNQIKIIVYVMLVSIKSKLNRSNGTSSRKIAIIFQQIFGDALLFSSVLEAYAELYPQNKGYELTIICRPSVKKFMEEVVSIPAEIAIQTLDFLKLVNDFAYYQESIDVIRNKYDTIIVPGSTVSAELLSAGSLIPTRIGLVQHKKRIWPPILSLLQKVAYTEIARPSCEMMALQRHKFFVQYLGLCGYSSHLPRLLKKDLPYKMSKYCVVAPGASKKEKCWPLSRYTEIVDYIIKEYGLNICICGGADEKEYSDYIMQNSNYKDSIVDYTGKTGFSEWSAIVQNADFVIGNDSATLHMAAASGRKAVCIAGVYDRGHFFPYDVDEIGKDERIPETVMVTMPCEFCRTKGYYSGFGNKECKRAIGRGECTICISKITIDVVKNTIDKLLRDNTQ